MLSNDPWLSELPIDFCPFFINDVENNVKIEPEPDFDDMSFGSDDSHTNIANSKQSKKQKKRKLNPDSMLIAAATESTLKSLQIDPNSAEGKRKKRQIRNRMSAQFHRDRKNGYIKKLEEEISVKCAEISRLKDTISILMTENASLQTQISNGSCRLTENQNIASLKNSGSISPSKMSTDNDDSDSCSLPVHSNASLLLSSKSSPIGSDEEVSISATQRSGSFSAINFLPSTRGLGVVNRSLTIVSAICMAAVCFLSPAQSGDYNSPAITSRRRLTEIDSSMYGAIELNQPLPGAVIEIESVRATSSKADEQKIEFSSVLPYNSSRFIVPDENDIEVKSVSKHLRSSKGRYLRANNNKDVGFNKTLGSNETDRGEPPMYTTSSSKNMALLMRAPASVSKYDTFGTLFGWPLNAYDFPVVSYSSVVMSEGHVLLDPALALSHKPFSLSSPSQRRDAVSTASMDSYKPLPYKPLSRIPVMSLPLTMYDASKNVKPSVVAVENESTNVPSHELVALEGKKLWPSREIADNESSSGGREESSPPNPHQQTQQQQQQQKQQFLAQILSELNLVTIRLPASAVKVGKSWVDSEDSTVESIMNVLNLTDDDSNKQSNSTTSAKSETYAVSHTSLEINCIIFGAKLLHHASSTAV